MRWCVPHGACGKLETCTASADTCKHCASSSRGKPHVTCFITDGACVLAWMQVPDTAYALDHMRPDMVLLMVLGRSLIMWDTIEPTEVSAGPWCAATQCSYSPCNMPEHVCCGRILSFYCVGQCSEALRPSCLPCQQCQECAQAGRSFHHNCWSATARPGSRSCKQRRCFPALLLLWLPFSCSFSCRTGCTASSAHCWTTHCRLS